MANDSLVLIGQMASVFGAILLVAAAVHDVALRTIPNWVSLGLCALGVMLRCLNGQLAAGLSLGLLVFALAAFCWKRRWLGGGDVKLLSAAAIFVSPGHVGDLLIAVTLSGGIVGLIYLVARSLPARNARPATVRPRHLLARILRAEKRRLRRGGPLPYASAIAAGTLLIIIAG